MSARNVIRPTQSPGRQPITTRAAVRFRPAHSELSEHRVTNRNRRARGAENRDFIREDRHSERCWVTIPTFNSHYPEIAEATDLGATLRSNMRESLPLENWGGHHSKLCCELPASSSAPQQLWGSVSLRGPDGGTGVPDVSP